VYVPAAQMNPGLLQLVHVWFTPNWIVRTSAPAAVARSTTAAVRSLDPLLPIGEFRALDERRGKALAWQRFQMRLLAALAGLALVLTVSGIYGLMAQSIAERRRELGIRLALGAALGRAVRDAALPGVLMALVGIAAGCVLSLLSGRVIEHLLYGVSGTDPATYAAVIAGLLAVALAASVVPALRITRINPAETLRAE
jgi:ABC-type antimicrobial peptide transport system permease subunit